MQAQVSDQQARKRIFIIIMVIIWFAALLIAPYYIAKPGLDTINQQRTQMLAHHQVDKMSNASLMKMQQPFNQKYSHYLAAVYIVFAVIWIFFPLVGLWVSTNLKKQRARRE